MAAPGQTAALFLLDQLKPLLAQKRIEIMGLQQIVTVRGLNRSCLPSSKLTRRARTLTAHEPQLKANLPFLSFSHVLEAVLCLRLQATLHGLHPRVTASASSEQAR